MFFKCVVGSILRLAAMFLCIGLCAGQMAEDVRLDICAAHYAPRGNCRFGLAGCGNFLEYEFGRTNTCDATAFEIRECGKPVLCVTNVLESAYRGFRSVRLCHERRTRRLFKVTILRDVPLDATWSDVLGTLRALAKDAGRWYDMEMPCDFLLNGDFVQWRTGRQGACVLHRWKAEDSRFAVEFILSRENGLSASLSFSVMSKEAKCLPKSDPCMAEDLEVELDGL